MAKTLTIQSITAADNGANVVVSFIVSGSSQIYLYKYVASTAIADILNDMQVFINQVNLGDTEASLLSTAVSSSLSVVSSAPY